MKCEIGIVFEVAALVGIKLFYVDRVSLDQLEESIVDKIALLPKKIQSLKVDDDF